MSEAPAAPPGNLVENTSKVEHSTFETQTARTGVSSTTRPWDDMPWDPSVRPWKEFKMSEPETPLPPQTQEPIPEKRNAWVADEMNAKGKMPLDGDGMVTRHWQRTFPPLYDTTTKVCKQFATFLTDTPRYDVEMLSCWLAKRPHLRLMMTGLFAQPYPWNDLSMGSHEFGAWWYAPLRQSVPDHVDLCRVGSVTTAKVCRFEKAIHSTSFYTVMNILESGLQCGPWDVKKKRGIFSYKPNGLARAKASSGYRIYSDLLHNGYFWGVALEVAFPSDVAHRRGSITAGQQTVTPEDETYITGAWFHCVHVADHCQANTCHMWCSCEDWEPEYEMRKQQIDWHDL